MTNLLDLDHPLPYRRTATGQRLCECPSGPCQRVASAMYDDGLCSACRDFCALRGDDEREGE